MWLIAGGLLDLPERGGYIASGLVEFLRYLLLEIVSGESREDSSCR